MIKVQIVSSKNSPPNIFGPKKLLKQKYDNKQNIVQNPVFIVFYQ